MIRILTLACFLMATEFMYSQSAINTKSPDASASLTIASNNKGVLLPQYVLTNLFSTTTPVSNPTKGSMIYNTGGVYTKGIYYWDGVKWNRLIVDNEMDQIINLRIQGTSSTSSESGSKIIIPQGTENNFVNFSPSNVNQYINTLGTPNPTGEAVRLLAGTYKINISFDSSSPTSANSNTIFNNNHLYVIEAAIYDANTNTPLTEVSTLSSISAWGSSSVQGYSFTLFLKLQEDKDVKVLLRHGSGRSTNVPTQVHQRGLVVNFRRMFE